MSILANNTGGHRHDGGFIALMCLLIVFISAVIVAAVASLTVVQLNATRKNVDHAKAMAIAEAGTDYGAGNLAGNSSYTGTSAPVTYGEGTFSVTVATNSGHATITSTGALPNGTTARIVVKADVTPGTLNAAIISNGKVTLSGGAGTVSNPANSHIAHVYANGNVGNGGTIDGKGWTHGSISGITCADTSYPNGRSGAPLITFPSSSDLTSWKNNLITQAQAGGTISGFTTSGTKTITSPCYVNGNITVNGGTLNVTGTGVVYVNGSVTISSSTAVMCNSAIFAASGAITLSGSAQYHTAVGTVNSELVSFSTLVGSPQNNNAIVLSGGSEAYTQGVVYAPYGGVTVSGGGYLSGAIVGGGSSALVSVSGGSQVCFPASMSLSGLSFPTGFPLYTNGGGANSVTTKSWLEQ